MALFSKPAIGDICRGSDIGKISPIDKTLKYRKFIRVACPDCGVEWWARATRGKPTARRCRTCHRHLINYKGGRVKLMGYIDILIRPDDFLFPMARNSKKTPSGAYVFEHRLIMAKSLGRCLHPWEIVHHKKPY